MKIKILVFLVTALALCGLADAQVYNKFGPATGVLKGSTATYQTSAAVSSDIIGLWSGCTGANFLRGDGTCTTPAGTGVSSVTVPAPLTATTCTGGACAITWTTAQTANRILATPDATTGAVSLRAMVAGDVPPINLGSTANGGVSSSSILLGTNGGTSNGFFSVTGPTTALRTFTFPNASSTVLTSNAAVTVPQGGTGVATLTNHGVLLGQGTSNVSAVAAMAADTLLQGQGASADPAAVSVNNCGSGTQALSYSTSTHTFGCQTITGVSTANPSATIGLTAVNGVASTVMASDSAPALSQTIAPTMTGAWNFTPSGTGAPVTLNLGSATSQLLTLTGSTVNGIYPRVINTNTTSNSYAGLFLDSGSGPTTFTLEAQGNAPGGAPFTGSPSGAMIVLGTSQAAALSVGTNGIERMRVASAGNVTVNAPTSGTALTVAPLAGAEAIRVDGASAAAGVVQDIFRNSTATGYTSFRIYNDQNTSSRSVEMDYMGSTFSGAAVTNGPSGEQGTIGTTGAFPFTIYTSNTARILVTSGGSVSMPNLTQTSAAQTGSVCWSSTALTVDTTVACLSSTIRVKQAVEDLDSGLPQVMALRPVSYDLKPEFNPTHLGRQVGLIAEEVQKVDPRLVALDDDGQPRGVRYMQMTAVLVKAIQQQQREIYALWAALALSVGFTVYRTRRHG